MTENLTKPLDLTRTDVQNVCREMLRMIRSHNTSGGAMRLERRSAGFVILYPDRFFTALENVSTFSQNTIRILNVLIQNMDTRDNTIDAGQKDLASLLGLELSSVNRLLKSMERAGIVKLRNRTVMLNPYMINASRNRGDGEKALVEIWDSFKKQGALKPLKKRTL